MPLNGSFEEFVRDPRTGPTEPEAELMPACDGGPWPPSGASDAVARQQIEFLAAYYHLNRLHVRLARARAGDRAAGGEAEVVAELQRGIGFRDLLEDQCAPTGFDAEPTLAGHLVVDLVFRHARKQVQENHRRRHPLEARVKVPLPDPGLAGELADVAGIPAATILADLRVDRGRLGRGPTGS